MRALVSRLFILVLVAIAIASCGQASDEQAGAKEPGTEAGTSLTCKPCVQTSDCGSGAACVQYAGSDYCGRSCDGPSDCAHDEVCLPVMAENGTRVSACVPSNGTCGQHGCGSCPAGTTCDLIGGECVEPEVDGGDGDAGEVDDGGPEVEEDAGAAPDAGTVAPYVGPDGGKVSKLYFAVIGDTRPPAPNDTDHYPSAIITKIYDDVQAMSPRPQFVVTSGDYMFASRDSLQGAKQMKLYLAARDNFKGTVFAALGNHECPGDDNCAGVTDNHNYNAFLDGLVKPLGKTKPYYSIPISDLNDKWTAKIVMVACNAWSGAQKTWLTNTLAKPTTYTFVVRHQPTGSDAPCNDAMAPILDAAKYNLFIVGHVHRYSHSGKQLVEGVGGAPLTGTSNYGYATVRQLDDGSFRVRQYDYKTKQVVGSFTLP